jgi:hypothetical protein
MSIRSPVCRVVCVTKRTATLKPVLESTVAATRAGICGAKSGATCDVTSLTTWSITCSATSKARSEVTGQDFA